jgi:uncharacterized repeat protein (TIGR01451 family)
MKPIFKLLLLLGLLLGGQYLASAQVFEWAKLAHNKGRNFGFAQGSSTDLRGNTYFGFRFADSARVGGQRLVAANGVNTLVRYDSVGQVRWVKQLPDVFIDYRGLAADRSSSGGVFVTGRFGPTPRWGTVAVPGGGNRNFYGKVSANGDLLWTNELPYQLNTSTIITADDQGRCYIIGSVDYRATIGTTQLDSTQRFLVSDNAQGNQQWVRTWRGTPPVPWSSSSYAAGIAQHGIGPRASGGCLIFGYYNQNLYFSGVGGAAVLSATTPATGGNFIMAVSPSGSLDWARPTELGSTSLDVRAAAGDQTGNYYVTGNSSSTLVVAKFNSAGSRQWDAQQPRPSVGPPSPVNGDQLALSNAGELTVSASAALIAGRPVATIGSLALRSANNLIHFDAAGRPAWTVGDGWSGANRNDFPYYDPISLGADLFDNLYWTAEAGTSSTTGPGGSSLVPPTITLGHYTIVGAGVLVARLGTRHNTIRGSLYLDQNGNGLRDASDAPFPQTIVLEATQPTLTRLGSVDLNGEFSVYVGPGSYTLPPPVPPLHYAVSQPAAGGYSGSFSGFGNVDSLRHFGFRPVLNQADLRATLTPYGAARPGFLTRQRLTLENVGTTTIPAGTATVTLDARAAFVSSTPPAPASGRTLTWSYPALAPFSRLTLDVMFSLPVNTPLGTVLNTNAVAAVAADVEPADNSATATQTVTGSFDPNDITVNYSVLSPAQVAAAQPLDYTIRFQNMGTDTAFTVVVSDALNASKLNLATMQLIAQSHNCIWSLTGAGLLTVRFLNIHLPHRGIDVIRSQGFVRFRVKPRTTLTVGETIPNQAQIFFDYNAPVVTNQATTTVMTPTAVLADQFTNAWTAYPNPARESLSVAAELSLAGIVHLSLLDALGRPVLTQVLTAPAGPLRQTLDLRALRPGLYVLRLSLPDGTATSRRIVRE